MAPARRGVPAGRPVDVVVREGLGAPRRCRRSVASVAREAGAGQGRGGRDRGEGAGPRSLERRRRRARSGRSPRRRGARRVGRARVRPRPAREPRHVIAPRRQLVVLRHPPRLRARDARARRLGHAVPAPRRQTTDARAARHRHRAPSERRLFRARRFSRNRLEGCKRSNRAPFAATRRALLRVLGKAGVQALARRGDVPRVRRCFPEEQNGTVPVAVRSENRDVGKARLVGGGDGARRHRRRRLFPLRARLERNTKKRRRETEPTLAARIETRLLRCRVEGVRRAPAR